MFNLFTRKKPVPFIRDLVYIDAYNKWQAAYGMLRDNPEVLIIAWFRETQANFQGYINTRPGIVVSRVLTTEQINEVQVTNKRVVFLEHYPLAEKEQSLILHWKVPEILVLNSLDEPLFTYFGVSTVVKMMKTMGVEADKPLESTLISEAIRRVQKEINKKVRNPIEAQSQERWFQVNWRRDE